MALVKVKWLGHAAFQIKGKDKTVYIDLGEGAAPSDKADLVLVTHSHWDHFDPKVIERVRKEGTVIIAPRDCIPKLGAGARAVEPGDRLKVGDLEVRAVHAYNVKRFRSPGVPFHPKGFGVGYVLGIDGKSIYHAGDTDFIPEMKELKGVDVAILPTGDTYTMNNQEAADAAITINPKIAIPMHRWNTDPEEFRRIVESRSGVTAKILRVGEELEL
ncbi:MAG: MBL fold metallo-hydrolase [Candidatus Methanomethylicota archaeon]|jgi:L-ascorbate metabolism protein UlaG (beta-lactamase superfamily)|uniref:MBL fold metallo-hydrolase n=1 Tax=Thermoproteota archaeon TaxID=2056631 RepID=A0A523BDJ3_9CREN|nr:MAG: MBL fold metallo-hydrolase [Candidatus Verstraetearchaeota archaeon]